MLSDKAKPYSLYCILLSAISLLQFYADGPTAFEWPAIDMAPFVQRFHNPEYLTNDFFTNTSKAVSPRQIYGYCIIFLETLLQTDWYGVFFYLKALYVLVIPVLIYLFFFGIIKHRITSDCKIEPGHERTLAPANSSTFIVNSALLILVGALVFVDFSKLFSIAWWQPLFFNATSQSFSLFLFLVGACIRLYWNKSHWKWLYLFFWIGASLIHIAMGMFLITFYLLATTDHVQWKKLIVADLLSIAIPAVILLLFFSSQHPVSSIDFIEIYSSRHARHYIVGELGSLTGYPWFISFLFVIAGIVLCLGIGIKKKSRVIILSGSLMLTSYVGCVLMQYVGAELLHSKFISAIGPTRYSFLGFWMVIYLSVLCLLEFRLEFSAPDFLVRTSQYIQFTMLFPALFILSVFIFLVSEDDPFSRHRNGDKEFYDWLSGTNPTDVFGANTDYCTDIPLIGNRAIFIGNGFPFNEQFFLEYEARHRLLYGPLRNIPKNIDRFESAKEYFGNLRPEDLQRTRQLYKLDYLILNKDQGKQLSSLVPCFENDRIKVFKLADLSVPKK